MVSLGSLVATEKAGVWRGKGLKGERVKGFKVGPYTIGFGPHILLFSVKRKSLFWNPDDSPCLFAFTLFVGLKLVGHG